MRGREEGEKSELEGLGAERSSRGVACIRGKRCLRPGRVQTARRGPRRRGLEACGEVGALKKLLTNHVLGAAKSRAQVKGPMAPAELGQDPRSRVRPLEVVSARAQSNWHCHVRPAPGIWLRPWLPRGLAGAGRGGAAAVG